MYWIIFGGFCIGSWRIWSRNWSEFLCIPYTLGFFEVSTEKKYSLKSWTTLFTTPLRTTTPTIPKGADLMMGLSKVCRTTLPPKIDSLKRLRSNHFLVDLASILQNYANCDDRIAGVCKWHVCVCQFVTCLSTNLYWSGQATIHWKLFADLFSQYMFLDTVHLEQCQKNVNLFTWLFSIAYHCSSRRACDMCYKLDKFELSETLQLYLISGQKTVVGFW